ncbi:hypothetical protein M5X11_34770 [Paenibacillus alginolyticus]|uniref:hypothetical protein n=1 Tax=Paenibacillus alginolyticus TaxID=59839 RepID=UPI000419BFB0|nr:hypothetical protein [Paenibacillus alginolyticus]MCY9670003.1 hypothetical protein [Paenibacillus alginolyticus]
MELMWTKSEAARQLGMGESGVRKLIERNVLQTVRMDENGREYVLGRSVLEERQRRINLIYDQYRRHQEGTCYCGCGEEVKSNRRFQVGHDERLKRALISTYLIGNKEDQIIAQKLAKQLSIKLDPSIKHRNISIPQTITIKINNLQGKEGIPMSEKAIEMLEQMKKSKFIFDHKLGQIFNKKASVYKQAVLDILDLLIDHAERVEFIPTMDKNKVKEFPVAIMFSEIWAIMEPLVPIPQTPFVYTSEGKNMWYDPCDAYFELRELLNQTDGPIGVCLNFKEKAEKERVKELISGI